MEEDWAHAPGDVARSAVTGHNTALATHSLWTWSLVTNSHFIIHLSEMKELDRMGHFQSVCLFLVMESFFQIKAHL